MSTTLNDKKGGVGHVIRPNENGFSLLGALMGMAIFVIGILAVFAMQTTATVSGGSSMKLTEANSWAQDAIEILVSSPYDDPNLEPPYGGGDPVDPLEPVDCSDGSCPDDVLHQQTEGPYTVKWVVFTSAHNGRSINSFAPISNDPMFDGVDKMQTFQDIPANAKLVSVHVSHPRGETCQFAFFKANI